MATKFIARIDKPIAAMGPTITITANRKLKASENGAWVNFNSATSLIATLPAPAPGLAYYFFAKVPAGSGVGHLIKTNGTTEKMYAKGASFNLGAGKGAVNTQATGAQGDGFWVWSDGTDWFGIAEAGTWAREA